MSTDPSSSIAFPRLTGSCNCGGVPDAGVSRRKVLVIEDDVALSRAIALRLDSRGFESILAHDGVTGLEELESKPDIVVLDLGLPKMRGLTVARRILESLETWHLPVIVITGDRSNNVSLYLHELGAAAVILKPFKADQLVDLIERTLGAGS